MTSRRQSGPNFEKTGEPSSSAKRRALALAATLTLAAAGAAGASLSSGGDTDRAATPAPTPLEQNINPADRDIIAREFLKYEKGGFTPYTNRAEGVAPGVQLPPGLAVHNLTPIPGGSFDVVTGNFTTRGQQPPS